MSHNDNIALLTQSHKAIASKKKAKREQIKEIVFDDAARRDFLTGFHKRKLAKAQAARSKAVEREREERKEARREQRRMLREQAVENAASVEKAYGALVDVDMWSGITNETTEAERDEQYEDEEVTATVTIVEDFDPDEFIHGPPPSQSEHKSYPPSAQAPSSLQRTSTLTLSKKSPKSKKVHYETSHARKRERSKQFARRTEKAELAGGKASHKKYSVRGGKKKASLKR